MAGIPERCLESSGLYLCGQTIKEASEEAFVFLLSQKILDFLQGWSCRRRIFYSDDYTVLDLFCRTRENKNNNNNNIKRLTYQ